MKTKFNPENKETLTYGETLEPAMNITDPEDAKQYFNDYVEWLAPRLKDEKVKLLELAAAGGNINVESALKNAAVEIAKSNLGYFAGYYSNETRQRVEKLFMCSHPIFGSIEKNGVPTAEEAFNAGFEGKTINEIRNG